MSAAPGTVARQAPLSMGFPRREDWSRLPYPSAGSLPDRGIGSVSPALAGEFFTAEPLGKPISCPTSHKIVLLTPKAGGEGYASLKGMLYLLSPPYP